MSTRPRAQRPATPAPVRATHRQHPLALSIVLHLFPGAALAGFVLLASPAFEAWGVDPFLAFVVGIGLVIAPLELGYLALHARRTTGSWSPLAAVDYRTRLPARRLALLAAGMAAWMLALTALWQASLDVWLAERVFFWVPEAILAMSTVSGDDAVSGGALAVILAAFFVFNGFVGPVSEELYFRGHLLPRIDRYGRGAPVLNTVLFGLYHLWTPWRWPAIILGFLPMSWMAWRTRSAWVAMAGHVIVNNVFILLLLAAYLGAR